MTKHPATAQAGTALVPVANGADGQIRPYATVGSPVPVGAATLGQLIE
jgi:hypothetical protein